LGGIKHGIVGARGSSCEIGKIQHLFIYINLLGGFDIVVMIY
jgi:hypothetical protein